MHKLFVGWCPQCVAGRSRGKLHCRVAEVHDGLFELDCTLRSHEGFEKAHPGASAAMFLTGIHRQNGLPFTSVVLKKSVRACAVAAACACVRRTERGDLILRGDGEHSL